MVHLVVKYRMNIMKVTKAVGFMEPRVGLKIFVAEDYPLIFSLSIYIITDLVIYTAFCGFKRARICGVRRKVKIVTSTFR